MIRAATPEDWPAIWRFMRGIVAAGETFSWDRDTDEATARGYWMRQPPGRTFVAVAADGTMLGTAEMGPNRGGPGAQVASAGFMVDPAHEARGVGRRLGERVLEQARADGYRAIQFNAVAASNVRAVDLWRSLGFDVLATVPEGFRHPTDATSACTSRRWWRWSSVGDSPLNKPSALRRSRRMGRICEGGCPPVAVGRRLQIVYRHL